MVMAKPLAPLRVGFNAALYSPTQDYRAAGLHRYIGALLGALDALEDLELTVFAPAAALPQLAASLRRAELRAAPDRVGRPLPRILWEQARLPLAAARAGLGLLHGPAHALPLLAPAPMVVTVHDLSFFRLPGSFPRSQGAYLRAATRLALRRARAVIAVSAFTARELVELLSVDPARIRVVHNGCDPDCRPLPPDEVRHWRRARGLPERFILSLATLQPRKNLGLLLEAYARLLAVDPAAPDLVLAGGHGWGEDDLPARAKALGLGNRVRLTGFVAQADLPWLYNAATLFAYPSHYEGFGLPVVEAMACGAPVVVAATSSLPEVVGGAGLALPADDPGRWAAEMAALLADEGRRAAMRRAGLVQAARFSWERAARETLEVYNRAAGGRVPARLAAEAPHGRP